MSEANLVVRITPQGFLEVVRGLQDVQKAVKSVDVTEAEWLAAKDRRAKELAAIAKAEMRATEERLRQERAASAALAAQERSDAAQRTQDLKLLLQARTAHDRAMAASSRQAAQAEQQAAKLASQARKAELAELEAVGKKELALQAQRTQAASRQRGMEWTAQAQGGYGPQMPKTQTAMSATTSTVSAEETATKSSIWESGIAKAALYMNAVQSAIALTRGFVAVASGFVQEAAKWERMDMALKDMEGSAQAAATATDHLYELAKAPAIDLATAQHAYLQLRALRMEAPLAEKVIKNFSSTIAQSGGGSVEFERVLRQLVQMQSKGRVLTQDLRIMQESMPRLTGLMQDAFGETTAEGIRKAGINAKQFVAGLLVEMDKIGPATQTLQSALENNATAYSRLKASFVDTEWTKGFLDSWTDVFEQITKLLKAKSVDWAGMIRAAMKGEMGRPDQYVTDTRDDYIAKALRDAPRLFAKKQYDQLSAFEKVKAGITRKTDYIGANEFGFKPSELTLKEFDPSVKVSGQSYNEYVKLIQSQRDNYSKTGDRDYITAKQPPATGMVEGKASLEKEKRDPVAEARKRLDALINTNTLEVAIRKNANDKMNELQEQGIDQSIINAIVERDRTVEEVNKKYKTIADLGYASEAQKKKLTDLQIAETLEATRKGNEKIELAEKEWTAKEDAKTRAANEKARKDDEAYWKDQQDKADKAKGLYLTELETIQKQYDDKHKIIVEATLLTEKERTKIEKAALAERNNQERAYYVAKMSLFTTGASDLFGAMAETRKGMTSESNDAYQALFAISKGFAIAKASMDLSSAVLSEYADPENVTFEMKMAKAGMVMAAGGALLGQINSAVFSGVFDKGGYIPRGGFGIAGENGPEIIQGPAHVTSTRDTARMLAGVSGGSSAPVVNIHNYAGASVTTSKNADGSLDVLIQQVAASVEKKIAGGISSGSSPVAGAIQGAYGVRR